MQTKEAHLISCIVPFYNENERVIAVLGALIRVERISHIICIDDGSKDPSVAERIKKQFPAIEMIRREKNSGKSAVIKFALDSVTTPYVLLFDADIVKIIPSEIERILNYIYEDPSIDLLILRRPEPWYIRFARWDILEAGERLMRTEDLRKAFLNNPPSGFMLEYATNSFMMQNHKKAYWVPYSGLNLWKNKKVGFIRGLVYVTTLHYDFVKYKGILFMLKSFLFFCKKEYRLKYL